MSNARSWWGWGTDAAAVTDDELVDLADRVALLGARPTAVAPPALPAAAFEDIALPRLDVDVSADPVDRARHAAGQGFLDVARAIDSPDDLRPPAAVVRPASAAEIERVLGWAADADIIVVPFGGGTSVVGGVEPSEHDRRGRRVVALDLERMSDLIDLDEVSGHARIGAGAMGPRVEGLLRPHGLTARFYPQSWEFSTVGGWVATRAGGHFATGPTHIDDLVAAISAVTPVGRWDSRRLPSSGAGPSPDRMMLGSEGALGVVADAWLRVRPRPVHRAQASVSFPSFAAGCAAIRAITQADLRPANARLLDPVEAFLNGAGDGSHALLALGFESAHRPCGDDLGACLALCRDHGGTVTDGPVVRTGDDSGTSTGGAGEWRRSFVRAPYLRDGLARLGMVVETFETAITWDRLEALVDTLRTTAQAAVTEVCGAGIVGVRLTHAYPDGAAPYVTVIAPGERGARVRQWQAIKDAVTGVLVDGGATITHHHAVGRWHADAHRRQVPAPFHAALRAAATAVDPNAILNPGVLGLR